MTWFTLNAIKYTSLALSGSSVGLVAAALAVQTEGQVRNANSEKFSNIVGLTAGAIACIALIIGLICNSYLSTKSIVIWSFCMLLATAVVIALSLGFATQAKNPTDSDLSKTIGTLSAALAATGLTIGLVVGMVAGERSVIKQSIGFALGIGAIAMISAALNQSLKEQNPDEHSQKARKLLIASVVCISVTFALLLTSFIVVIQAFTAT